MSPLEFLAELGFPGLECRDLVHGNELEEHDAGVGGLGLLDLVAHEGLKFVDRPGVGCPDEVDRRSERSEPGVDAFFEQDGNSAGLRLEAKVSFSLCGLSLQKGDDGGEHKPGNDDDCGQATPEGRLIP